jgi:hypothetical protein
VDYFSFRSEPLAGAWTGFSQDPDYALSHDLRHHLIDGFTAFPEIWSRTEKCDAGKQQQFKLSRSK